MKPISGSALSTVVIAALLFLPEGSQASKMQPGLMSHKGRFGLNANTDCRRPRFNICQGCNVSIRMRVKQNAACAINFKSLGPFAGQETLVRPKHGIYGSANETAAAYRPNANYLGEDHFETRVYFEEGNGKRTFINLTVNVFVVPNL